MEKISSCMKKFQKLNVTLKIRSELAKMPNEVIIILYEEIKRYLSKNNISKDLK